MPQSIPQANKLDLALAAKDTPQHDKLTANAGIKTVSDLSQAIGEFLEWLPQQGIYLAEDVDGWSESRLVPSSESIPDMLAAYFEVDQNALEMEKRAILDALRAVQNG